MALRALKLLQDTTPGRHAAWAGVALLSLLLWLGLEQLSAQLWFLPAGLRLALLWLVPTRRWGWLGAAEILAQATKSLVLGYPLFSMTFLAVCVAPWVIYAAVVFVARGPLPGQALDTPTRMLAFLLAGLLGAAGVSPLLWMFLVTVPMSAIDSIASMFTFMYGDMIGQLVLAPLLVALAHGRLWPRRLAFWRDIGVVMLGAVGMFLLLQAYDGLAMYVLLLAFAPLFFLGFRHGWEAAALGTLVLGAVIQALVQGGLLSVSVTMLQLVLAVVGAGALVLGAASTALRHSHEVLAQRHQELAAKNDELAALAEELRQVTQRLVRIEEQGQRELASELDYELGHAIHAVGTRISLAFRDVRDEQGTRFLESLREQVREIQDSLRRALRQLRPPLLDSHGLRHAIDNGPLREMLEDGNILFEPRFTGPVDQLDDDARTAAYRICQAAVREAVRLESVRRFAVDLAVSARDSGGQEVALCLDIEFSPYARAVPALQPLPAIFDRVLAEHGSYQLEPIVHGQRHLVRFEAGTGLA
ncbi:MAG TPA: MASE1 domain-containing protein [Arenimonas sp.]|uniref:MASE1 domain-containing protein n=1 Tax=Arenimonas sp. TaxID=1872635 RepID=UPI002D7FC4C9|nr:MASE1 domain-containing protein [Arenimonas sp.]HEU0153526.1 MASE1 domain-containing protein [Arenimonas sp.]